MFQKILVSIDGSLTSLAVIDWAVALAKVFGCSVTAVDVIDSYPVTGVGADFVYGQDQYLGVPPPPKPMPPLACRSRPT